MPIWRRWSPPGPRGRPRPSSRFIGAESGRNTSIGPPPRKLASRYKADKEALEAEYQKVRDEILETFKREAGSVEAEYSQVKQKIDAQAKNDRGRAKKAQEETRWQALAMYEAGRDGAVKSRKQDEETLAVTRGNFEEIQAVAEIVMRRCKRLAGPEPTSRVQAVPATKGDAENQPQAADPADSAEPQPQSQVLTLQEAVKQADTELLALESLKLAGFLRLQNFVWPFILLGLVLVVALGFSVGWTIGGVAGVVIAVAAGIGSYIGLAKLARPHVARHYFPLRDALANSEQLLEQTKTWVKTEYRTAPARDRTEPGTRSEESR